MHYFLKNFDFFKKEIRLDFSKIAPEDVIRRFFEDYNLPELRGFLWEWLEVAITTENDYYAQPSDRANLLFLYQRLEELLEANNLLSQQGKNGIQQNIKMQ